MDFATQSRDGIQYLGLSLQEDNRSDHFPRFESRLVYEVTSDIGFWMLTRYKGSYEYAPKSAKRI